MIVAFVIISGLALFGALAINYGEDSRELGSF